MRASTRRSILGFLLVAGLAAGSTLADPAARPTSKAPDGTRITGPYTHQNLDVFLIHAKDRLPSANLLTLQEALERKKIVVHETGNVNTLAVENLSGDADIYIQAGDIVKGGQQDRMISQDFIVPARSGRMPIGAFCVEHGRWSRRANESVAAFDSSADQAVGKALKIAARRDGDQAEVWKQVAAAQDKLTQNVVGFAAPAISPSSLQLALEDSRVGRSVETYVKALSGTVAGQADAVGVAFAVNGRLSSVEIYASRSLLTRLWPKLLRAAAVEAISEANQRRGTKAVSAADVRAWLAAADASQAREKELSARVKLLTRESEGGVLFETRDREKKDAWVHRSYVAK